MLLGVRQQTDNMDKWRMGWFSGAWSQWFPPPDQLVLGWAPLNASQCTLRGICSCHSAASPGGGAAVVTPSTALWASCIFVQCNVLRKFTIQNGGSGSNNQQGHCLFFFCEHNVRTMFLVNDLVFIFGQKWAFSWLFHTNL